MSKSSRIIQVVDDAIDLEPIQVVHRRNSEDTAIFVVGRVGPIYLRLPMRDHLKLIEAWTRYRDDPANTERRDRVPDRLETSS